MFAILSALALPELPGANLLGAGFDAATGGTPKDVRPILKLSVGSKTFTNPRDPSIIYSVPDEFFVTVATHVDTDITTDVSFTSSAYASSLTKGISVSGGGTLKGSPFSANAGVSTAESYLSKRSQYSATTKSEMFATVYHVTLPDPAKMTLSDEFQSDVEALPAYTPGLPEYAKFVERYGTHCLLSSYFGGKGVSQVYVNTKEAQTYSTSDISIQAGIKYKFAAQISSDDSQSWFNGYDQTRSEIHTFMEGGDPGLADDLAHWGDWISSFFQYPVSVYNDQFKMTLVPIEQLVPAAKRDDVAQALADHLAAIPYPDDPDCSATVLCMGDDRFDGSCCTKDYPSCCYQNDATQCYSNTNDVCCGDDHACSAGHQCCGNGCTGGSSRCCNDADGGDRSCSSPFINCCADKSVGCCSDGHSTCCNLENQQYCCPDGWGCIDLWPFGVGCNPLGDEDPADTVKINATQQVIDGIKMYPRKSSGHKKAKFPATNMNDFVELMAARS